MGVFTQKTKVILDTNILLLPGQIALDVFTEIPKVLNEPHVLCTYQVVLDELQKLMEKKTKDAFNAKLGFVMSKQKALKILKGSSEMHVDDFIVKNTGQKSIVVTQDKKLIERLKKMGVRCLRYQQKKFIFQ